MQIKTLLDIDQSVHIGPKVYGNVVRESRKRFYLEIEQANRAPGETAEAILGAGGWPQAKNGFYEAAEKDGIELPAELKGSKEVNLLIQEALLEGWRPGERMSETISHQFYFECAESIFELIQISGICTVFY